MKLKKKKIIYVDVDGTICQNRDDLRDKDISIAYSDVKPYHDRIAHINSLYDESLSMGIFLDINYFYMFIISFISIIILIIAGLYPSIMAANIDPIKSIRHGK